MLTSHYIFIRSSPSGETLDEEHHRQGQSSSGDSTKKTLIPPTIPILLEHRDQFWSCVPARNEDTDEPLQSLYRMYAALVMDNNVELRNEFEYFFNHASKKWSISSIPDPKDSNAQRYAIVSVIPELLCQSFNRLIEMDIPRDRPAIIDAEEEERFKQRPKILETVPSWCAGVPALIELLVISDRDGAHPDSKESVDADSRFAMKNIVITDQTLFFT